MFIGRSKQQKYEQTSDKVTSNRPDRGIGSGRFPLTTLEAAKHNLNIHLKRLNKDPDTNMKELKNLISLRINLTVVSVKRRKKKSYLLWII